MKRISFLNYGAFFRKNFQGKELDNFVRFVCLLQNLLCKIQFYSNAIIKQKAQNANLLTNEESLKFKNFEQMFINQYLYFVLFHLCVFEQTQTQEEYVLSKLLYLCLQDQNHVRHREQDQV